MTALADPAPAKPQVEALRLGELLVRAGKLSPRDLDQALAAQREMGDLLGRVLVRLGLLAENDVAQALAEQLQLPLVAAAQFPEQPLAVPGLTPDYLISHGVLPLRIDGGELHAALAMPQDRFLLKALQLATGLRLRPALALESVLHAALERLYREPEPEAEADAAELDTFTGALGGDSEFVEHLKDLASEAPVIRLVNQLVVFLGGEPKAFLTDPNLFRGILVTTTVWQTAGWSSIIYLAAMATINPELYEAATVDGANRFQRMLYITVPSISFAIVITLIFAIGGLLNAGFEQILLLYSPAVYEVADIIDTYVYRVGLLGRQYSFGAAIGLFKSVLALLLMVIANQIARRLGQPGLW